MYIYVYVFAYMIHTYDGSVGRAVVQPYSWAGGRAGGRVVVSRATYGDKS